MKKGIFLIPLLIIFCLTNLFSQNSNNYEIEINKKLWKTEPINADEYVDSMYLNDGNLHIHFQSAFEKDTAEIKVNGEFYGKYALTTEWSLELADVIVIPKFETIKSVSISINDGKPAVFEIEKMNQIIVRLRENKLLIGFRKHVPYYD
jgi:hypothetical protein